MPFPNGIPSASTISRVLTGADEELVSNSIINWVGEIYSMHGIHVAIDGKGLRAAARKVRDGKTPYILNALDVSTKLVIGQLAIPEKANEMTAIPELVKMLDIGGSTVTVDAVGATENIMNAICEQGADFVLQVKGNCPSLLKEINDLFIGLEREQNEDKDGFSKKHSDEYSKEKVGEKNRERYEYRTYESYHDDIGIRGIQEERPHVECIGRSMQVRIKQIQDSDGNDITPGLEEFMKNGSSKQPRPKTGDEPGDDIQRAGIIASRVMDAKEMMDYKRAHWAVENSLHYVLDETFGEDKSTIKNGKNTMSMLRKCAYNIARMLQMEAPGSRKYIPDVISDICADLDLGIKMIFTAIPSRY